MANQSPLINGAVYEFASIELYVNGQVFTGIKSISYKQSKKRGKKFGTSVVKQGRTRGQLEPEASIEFYKADYYDLISALTTLGAETGQGYMDVEFPIVCMYSEIQGGGEAITTDELVGCTLDEEGDDHSEGTDPLTMKTGLDLFWILRNGNPAVIELPTSVA